MRILKAWLPDGALQLDDASLGAFIKLKALASQMTVKGVMVNGKVLSIEDMVERAELGPDWKVSIEQMVSAGLLMEVKGVWLFVNSRELFPNTKYGDYEMGKVFGVIRTVFSGEDLSAVRDAVTDAGEFKKERTIDEVRDDILKLYDRFEDKRGMVISYMASFRTKIQAESNARMDGCKHLRLLKELIELFDSKVVEYKGQVYPFADETFFRAIDIVAQRRMVALNNHNYFKAVLSNSRSQAEKGKGPRGTSEGY